MTDIRQAAQQAMEALENAVRYHGIMLMADPPQDAWKYHRVEDNAKQAITAIKKALAQPVQPVQEPTDIAALVEGMEVSIDVSTGEHDSDNRLFGTVTLAQENQGSKHGLILLIQDAKPNFQPAPPEQEPVQQQAEPCIGKDPRCPCQDGDACHYKDCGGTKAWPVQRKPLTDDVLVPLEVLEAAASSLDSFCGNLDWGDADLQTLDNLFAVIEQHKAAHNIKEGT
jgi:hypothetical protein